jgi:hypothetical protein
MFFNAYRWTVYNYRKKDSEQLRALSQLNLLYLSTGLKRSWVTHMRYLRFLLMSLLLRLRLTLTTTNIVKLVLPLLFGSTSWNVRIAWLRFRWFCSSRLSTNRWRQLRVIIISYFLWWYYTTKPILINKRQCGNAVCEDGRFGDVWTWLPLCCRRQQQKVLLTRQ